MRYSIETSELESKVELGTLEPGDVFRYPASRTHYMVCSKAICLQDISFVYAIELRNNRPPEMTRFDPGAKVILVSKRSQIQFCFNA